MSGRRLGNVYLVERMASVLQEMDIHMMKLALGLEENHGASSKLQKGSCIENLPGRLSAGPLPMKDAMGKKLSSIGPGTRFFFPQATY